MTLPPDLKFSEAEDSAETLKLRGCLAKGAVLLLLFTSFSFAVGTLFAPQWVFEANEPLWLEVVDQIAFQAMLLGFALVLLRPSNYRPYLLTAKAGFCYQLALGTGGQSFTAMGPRLGAIAFMFVSMWYLISRLGIGALTIDPAEPPPP